LAPLIVFVQFVGYSGEESLFAPQYVMLHRGTRARRIAVRDRLDDGSMLAAGGIHRFGRSNAALAKETQLASETVVYLLEAAVVRCRDKDCVELCVEIPEAIGVSTIARGIHSGKKIAQALKISVGDALRRQLAGHAHQPRPQIVEIDDLLAVVLADEKAAVDLHFEQASLCERTASLAQRSSADAQTRSQGQLVDAFAASKLTLQNQASDFGLANAD